MKVRIISSIIGAPLVVFAIAQGGTILGIILALIALIGLYEFYNVFNTNKVLMTVGSLVSLSYFLLMSYELKTEISFMFIIFILIILIIYVIMYPRIHISNVVSTLFGVLYVSYLLSHIYLVRDISTYGPWFVWLIFITAWGSDTCAYFVGITIGKRKLAPELSPNKSVEGAIGGVVGAIILSVIYGWLLINKFELPNFYMIYFGVIGGLGSVLSMFGDLAASAIKRNLGKKDFGKIIPGHGGILDRFDSILFTAPFIFLVAQLFIYII